MLPRRTTRSSRSSFDPGHKQIQQKRGTLTHPSLFVLFSLPAHLRAVFFRKAQRRVSVHTVDKAERIRLCHRNCGHCAVLQVKRNVADVVVSAVLRRLRLPDVGAVEVIGGLAVAAFVAVAVIELGLVCRDAVKRFRVFRQQRFLAVADLDAARLSSL